MFPALLSCCCDCDSFTGDPLVAATAFGPAVKTDLLFRPVIGPLLRMRLAAGRTTGCGCGCCIALVFVVVLLIADVRFITFAPEASGLLTDRPTVMLPLGSEART